MSIPASAAAYPSRVGIAHPIRVFSFGGGVQSTAALVLAARGELDCDAMLFANVGDDSENPDTLRYVREVAMPYAQAHGVPLIELRQCRPSDGRYETVYGRVMSGRRGLVIPVHLAGSGPMRRQCTQDFKISVVNRWLRQHGATRSHPATVMLGISTNEELRARKDIGRPAYRRVEYPFLERGRRMSRAACADVIRRAGLPVPPKSSCFFCPYHSVAEWRDLRDRHPDHFAQAADMERHLTEWSARRGHRAVYLSNLQRPLTRVVGDAEQPRLFGVEDTCESGYCMV